MSAPYLVLEADCELAVSAAESKQLLQQISTMDSVPVFNIKTTKVRRFDLSFYEDADLIELRNPHWRPLETRLCFLRFGKTLRWLDGTSPPIHETNQKADLVLTNINILNYLAFFCFFVRGDVGPFLILDRCDNPFIPESIPKERIEENFRPPKIWGQDENGDWRVTALVYYSDAVFAADFLVQLTGMIEMYDDWPVLADLEYKIEAPLIVEVELNG